jgi:hypothetical protein
MIVYIGKRQYFCALKQISINDYNLLIIIFLNDL